MFLEKHNIKEAFAPVDLNAAAVVGSRVSIKGCEKIAIVISVGTSLTGGVVDISLKQHNASTAGTSKAIAVAHPYFKKVGADTSFTKVEVPVAADNYVLSSDFDVAAGTIVFEINAADLDVNNDFAWISVNLADGGVAKLGHAIYVLGDNEFIPAYSNAI